MGRGNKNRNNNSPVKNDDNNISNILTNGTYEDMDQSEVMRLVLVELNNLRMTVINYHEEVKTLKQKQMEMDHSLKYLNNEVEDLQSKIKLLTADNANLKADMASLSTTTESNSLKISASQDYSRKMNLELTDIPYIDGEDCSAIALEVFDKVGVSMPEKEISVAHRVKVKSNNYPNKNPSIIVKFRDLYFRNKVIDCRSSNRVKLIDMGFSIPSDSKFNHCYINEHLTPDKKRLLYLARKLKLEKNWFHVGVHDGKLFARKVDGGTKVEIQQDKDLAIFNN